MKRSRVWEEFTEVTIETGDPPVKVKKAKCKRCGALLAADSKKVGTTSLNKHIISCSKKHKSKSSQSLLKHGRDYYLLPREAQQDENE